jgi:hypothetical protein
MKSWKILVLAACGLTATACSEQARSERSSRVGSATQAVGSASARTVLAWGKGTTGVGLTAAVQERPALGPQSVAVDPQGRLLVLDAQNKRVVRVEGAGGELTTLAEVPVDADEIAVGPNGAFAVRRQLSRRVSIFSAGGASLGEVDVPTEAGDVMHVTLGISNRIYVESPNQETLSVGSPAAPVSVPSMWSGKKEGMGQLSGGRTVQVVKDDRGLFVRVLAFEGEKWGVRAEHKLQGDAGHVAGTTSNTACLRVEKVHADMTVDREAVCVDATTGDITLKAALPAPGLYVPRRELVLSHGKLVFTRPTAQGLEIATWEVAK